MADFPQLSTGATAQYPLVSIYSWRNIENLAGGSRRFVGRSGEGRATEYQLSFQDLTAEETEAIWDLFRGCEGRLRTFRFLDPTANLLAWTEDFTQPCWVADPGLTVTNGAPDPANGTSAVRVENGAETLQGIEQHIAAPNGHRYTWSVYVRSSVERDVWLVAGNEGAQQRERFRVGPEWSRPTMQYAGGEGDDGVWFGLELPREAVAHVYGPQVEAQPNASLYKRNGARTGVYPAARFADDKIEITATGPGLFRTKVRILAR